VADNGHLSQIGFRRPPEHTQFVKGQSGNPKGRPKGSQNLGTLLEKIIRQRVTVTERGRTRDISKAEAILTQLMGKALRGDIGAMRELRSWMQYLEESSKAAAPPHVLRDEDTLVIASMLARIRNSKPPTPGDDAQIESPRGEK
jgi:hypothetical protein